MVARVRWSPVTNLYDDLRAGGSALGTPRTALTVGAHPDDAEFGAGGTLARWAASGCEVTLLILTDGSKGTWDEETPVEDLVTARRQEQERAAHTLGATRVVHLDHVDGELENSPALREEICRWIRTVRPEVVLGHDPWRRYMLHPDHRAAGMGLIDAVVAARDHLFYPHQGLEKHRPSAVLLWQAQEVDHHEDITAMFGTKVEALLCHSSQGSTTMGDAQTSSERRDVFVAKMREIASRQGSAAGVELAEGFKLLRP